MGQVDLNRGAFAEPRDLERHFQFDPSFWVTEAGRGVRTKLLGGNVYASVDDVRAAIDAAQPVTFRGGMTELVAAKRQLEASLGGPIRIEPRPVGVAAMARGLIDTVARATGVKRESVAAGFAGAQARIAEARAEREARVERVRQEALARHEASEAQKREDLARRDGVRQYAEASRRAARA